MKCREHCGACCIAPSINQPYFGMPNGKAAGEACTHLNLDSFSCTIWGSEHYPNTCQQFQPEEAVCGSNQAEAIRLIDALETLTDHTIQS